MEEDPANDRVKSNANAESIAPVSVGHTAIISFTRH